MKKLLVATGNKGKVREIQALLGGMEIELITPAQIGLDLEVEENGNTYAENAALKAAAFATAANLLTMADDSGLEVQALGGQPGIRSARFSTKPGATDADRRAYLLQRLETLPRPWTARFCCAIALAAPGKEIRFAEGECQGEIIPEERGQNGFGYDPIFYIPTYQLTMAELTMEQKNRLSHRARAITASRPILEELLENQ